MYRVLIVDDKEENLYLLRTLLQGNGYEVDEARHGAEALVRARQTPPDLIISDLLMPVMDGYMLLGQWKADERLKQIPFVIYTATFTEPKDEKLARDLGADAFILKPAELEPFLARLNEMLTREKADELIHTHLPPVENEQVILKEYSEALIRKLEGKTAQLEQTNRELAASEARLRAIIDTEPESVNVLAVDGTLREMNRAGLQMIEADSFAQVANQYMHSLVTPAYRAAFQVLNNRVLRGETGTLEFEIVGLKGGRHWLETHVTPLRDAAGKVSAILGITRDITERKQAEAALRESEKRLNFALQMSRTGGWDLDLVDHTAYRTLEHDRIFGYGSLLPQWTYEIFLEHVLPEDRAEVDRCFREATAAQTTWSLECRIRRRDGEVRWIWAAGEHQRDDTGLLRRMAGIVQDITERKQAEAALMQTEARYRTLLNSSPAVIYATATITGSKRVCTFVSETLKAITGHSPQDMLNNPWFWLMHVHPDDVTRVIGEIDKYIEHGGGTVEYRFRHKDDQYRWIRDSFLVLHDADGQPIEVIGSWSDITDVRRTEEQLAQAQKMEAVGQLTGGIAHDFNNRLTVIIGNLELLQRKLNDDPVRVDIIKSALSAAEGAADLTHRLLTISRRQVLDPVEIDINALLSGMHDMLKRTLGETITIVIAPGAELWPVRADRSHLENVLLNLTVNARDAMPKGGQLTIETHNTVVGNDYVENHADAAPGAYVMLAVSDTGEGMSKEVKRHVFEPFFTTKAEGMGTGLGLSMVYGFVKQSKGHIELYSEPGHGSSFKIYLPRDSSAVVAESVVTAHEKGDANITRGKTILLVEDDEMVRKIAVTLLSLSETECLVLIADSGPAALELFARQPDIDLLFTDMIMPGGMNGLELAAKMRERLPGLRVLYTSGYAPQAAADHRVIEHPNDYWLAKPYQVKALREMLHTIFKAQS